MIEAKRLLAFLSKFPGGESYAIREWDELFLEIASTLSALEPVIRQSLKSNITVGTNI
jgi:hypothetical protein